MAVIASPLSPIILIPKSLPKYSFFPLSTTSLASPTAYSPRTRSHSLNLPNAVPPKSTRIWRTSATFGTYSLSEAIPSEEIVITGEDGISTVISVLLFIAFIGLSVLSIGVIYIAVTDFLQKREREKFEKEESVKKKKNGKKGKFGGKARASAGPRGFGQKIEDKDDDDNDTSTAA